MKTMQIYDRPDVQVPDFLQKILKANNVKSFHLSMIGEDARIDLHVLLEKVTKVDEAQNPETFQGVASITVIL